MSLIKTEYRIERWDDKYTDGEWVEEKVAVVGAHDMEDKCKAYNPNLTMNISGEITLSFEITTQYFNVESQQYESNYLLPLLYNEAKIKLYCPQYKNDVNLGWFDFVIKERKEIRKKQLVYQFNCEYLPLNELRRTGQELVFNVKLQNNVDTLQNLAEKVLKDSGWDLKANEVDLLEQIEEQLFEYTLPAELSADKMQSQALVEAIIPSDSKIYLTFGTLTDAENPRIQFIYIPSSTSLILKNDIVINNKHCYYYAKRDDLNLTTSTTGLAISQYRGYRLNTTPLTEYDDHKNKKRYVNVYSRTSPAPTKYYSIDTFTIPKKIVLFQGTGEQYAINAIDSYVYRTNHGLSNEDTIKFQYLSFASTTATVPSTGVDYYVINKDDNRFQLSSTLGGAALSFSNTGMAQAIDGTKVLYRENHGYDNNDEISFSYIEGVTSSFDGSSVPDLQINTIYYVINKTDNTFQISKTLSGSSAIDIYGNGYGVIGQDVSTLDKWYEATKYYYYYDENDVEQEILNPSENASENDRKYSSSPWNKIRTLNAEEENRFNLIQQIAELFEVWVKFDISHDINGRITKKEVVFVNNIGEEKSVGFEYGINLNGIERTINSDNLTTKLKVKDVVNDALPNGFCSIAEASENPAMENFIIDLSYYVLTGVLNLDNIKEDLYYRGSGTGIAYYSELKRLNLKIKSYNIDLEDNKTNLAIVEERLAAATTSLSEWNTALKSLNRQNELKAITTANYNIEKARIDNFISVASKYVNTYTQQKIKLKTAQTDITDKITNLLDEKTALHNTFNTKYARYLQEGSWEGSNYISDNTYYYDALKVLYESSRPQVEYNIDLVDLSVLDEYDYYNFQVGDITFVHDQEFFGYGINDTAYKVSVVVTEISANLDDPRSNKIVVRNYKNQFDELFERITATVQSYEFNENSYQKASERFENGGGIVFSSLQKALLNNELILNRSAAESFVQDNTGITLTNLNNDLEKVRIVSGGIFLTNDGGINWSTGITGSGINADNITVGSIDTGRIRIYDQGNVSFIWDKLGLTAYKDDITSNTYVRFNSDGLIAKNNGDTIFNIDASTGNATFKGDIYADSITLASGITIGSGNLDLSGTVQLGTSYNNVKITTLNGLQVFDGSAIERVKIGALGGGLYGLLLKNASGVTQFTVDSNGNAIFGGSISTNHLKVGINSSSTFGQIRLAAYTSWDAVIRAYDNLSPAMIIGYLGINQANDATITVLNNLKLWATSVELPPTSTLSVNNLTISGTTTGLTAKFS